MKVNSVASYNNQLQNRTNVKFGDCKKIVCDKSMIEAKKAFENSLLKQGLDKMYVYQVEFSHKVQNNGLISSEYNYSMIIKPYIGSLLYRLKNHFNHDFKLPNLPCEIKYEARCLNTSKRIDPHTASVIASLPFPLLSIFEDAIETRLYKEGLIDKINRFTVYDIREKIKNALDKKAQQ